MRSVALLEAKDTFSELVAEAGRGESIVITDEGRPVATLNPPPTEDARAKMQAAIKDIKAIRATMRPDQFSSTEQLIADKNFGRR